ncbi:MAG TPA: 50S ribosomal protein L11 methyltransferase [Pyrinomonadaceae bacterium]|jgi:predicted RNA methylase
MAETIGELVPKVQNIFEFLSVHREMIYDDVRTSAFSRAISEAVKPGDVVLDLGTGTGLLALMAVRAKARKVYAIEKTNIIEVAKANAKRVIGSDIIEFLMADSRSVELPERVDVIVSEVIGHLVVEENMLDSMIDARDRFLKPGGIMVPNSAEMYFVPVENKQIYEDEIGQWSKLVHEIDLSASKDFAVNNIYIGEFKEKQFLASPKVLLTVDLARTTSLDMTFKGAFEIKRKGMLHGVAGWFVASLYADVRLSTAPNSKPTHWQQCFLPIKKPIPVHPGDIVHFSFSSKSIGDDVEICWEILTPSAKRRVKQSLSRSTLQNERTFSLKNIWLNQASNKTADAVAKYLIDA